METGKFKIFFDERDYRLLDIVNAVLDRGESFSHLNDLLYPHLHPHGIKELAESRGLRIAYAVIHLLGSLDSSKADERLNALRSLRDEVLNSADSHMRRNTARVLLQIMKELVRTREDRLRQLELAHDFRFAVSGKPLVIRRLLREHHLLEMPEEWNQISFDGHVHDSSTKGRKSPSHLIMDAWIKGIRCLTIIHYNYVDPEPVAELLEAARIMSVKVRVGVEFPAGFYDKFVRMIWAPRGFSDAQDFLSFLRRTEVEKFLAEGREVSEFTQERVLATLEEFNNKHRLTINEEFGLDLPPLGRTEFLASVKTGQASILHLARFVHACLLPVMQERVAHLREIHTSAGTTERKEISRLVCEMNEFDSEKIVERFFRSDSNAGETVAQSDNSDLPGMLRLSPSGLIAKLNELHSGFRITLNLSKLGCEDILELLYDCKGAITHLETFNLKDYVGGKAPDYTEIMKLQQVVNAGNILKLTLIVRKMLDRMRSNPQNYSVARIRKFEAILKNSKELISHYRNFPLGSSLGSDSTGQSCRSYGMGFAVTETLPCRIQSRLAKRRKSAHPIMPVKIEAMLQTTVIPKEGVIWKKCGRILQAILGKPILGRRIRKWEAVNHSIAPAASGNIIALGGIREACNGFCLEQPAQRTRPDFLSSWRYLNGILKNTIKILAGFIPSVLTFMYTQDWWFLVYLGTPIWFAITGFRNVLQSVFGGDGIRRSPLLKWNSYVSWDRMSDSLLYTGISVPLLEYLVRVLLLEQTFDITTTTDPVMLYSIMSVVNGAYISGHNIMRGLPREAIIGNLFRSILNIPLSIGFNSAISTILHSIGVVGVNEILQQWASIISKTSSDCVAGIIEGIADKRNYIRIRTQDYNHKISELFSTYEKLEILFPESEVLELLVNNKLAYQNVESDSYDFQKFQIVNALDLLYFWMYQPRARTICTTLLKKMTGEELQIFIRTQAVLHRKSEVARLFVDGLVGENWSKALAFYLNNYHAYLISLENMHKQLSANVGIFRRSLLTVKETTRLLSTRSRGNEQLSFTARGS